METDGQGLAEFGSADHCYENWPALLADPTYNPSSETLSLAPVGCTQTLRVLRLANNDAGICCVFIAGQSEPAGGSLLGTPTGGPRKERWVVEKRDRNSAMSFVMCS